MDRNSVIGLFLIGIVLVVFTIINKPERDAAENQNTKNLKNQNEQTQGLSNQASEQSLKSKEIPASSDSLIQEGLRNKYGSLTPALAGRDTFFTIENDLLIARIASKGGYIQHVQLKNYKNWEQKPLILFSEDSAHFNISIPFGNNFISTSDLFFLPEGNQGIRLSGADSAVFVLSAKGVGGNMIQYRYSLKGNSPLIGVALNTKGLEGNINTTASASIDWMMRVHRQEKNLENEKNNTTVYYKFDEDEVDKISPGSEDKSRLDGRLKWIAFKQQYFTSAIIARESFDHSAEIQAVSASGEQHTKTLKAAFGVPLSNNRALSFTLFFGPTQYKVLSDVGFDFQKQIPLGWGVFGYVNKFIVIPVFNFLDQYNLNYGIVILLLTLVIKLILFPLQFKSYMSQAKMRVIKPEIDELNLQYEKEDPMKKQQAILALYRKAGVNPLGGCLPLLFQMPILFAMFNFFPAAFELRQKSFLWAEDLSTFDSVLSLPFKIPFYGNHVSLFALLMTASTIIYTRMNNQLSGSNNQMMPGMKFMMYAMPVVFLFVLNSYAAGLNYYYFLANVITFGQQALFQGLVDDKKIHAKIQENKKRPQASKQSSFQKRLEEMAKKRGYTPPSGKR